MHLLAPTHLIVLLLVILVIFGPSKLGEVSGALGKGIRDFKRAINEPESIPAPAAKPVGEAQVEAVDRQYERASQLAAIARPDVLQRTMSRWRGRRAVVGLRAEREGFEP